MSVFVQNGRRSPQPQHEMWSVVSDRQVAPCTAAVPGRENVPLESNEGVGELPAVGLGPEEVSEIGRAGCGLWIGSCGNGFKNASDSVVEGVPAEPRQRSKRT